MFEKLFEALAALFSAIKHVFPDKEERMLKHERTEARLQGKELNKVQRQAFNYLKNREEIDIDTYLEFQFSTTLSPDELADLKQIMNERITQHREERPRRFRKWLEGRNKPEAL